MATLEERIKMLMEGDNQPTKQQTYNDKGEPDPAGKYIVDPKDPKGQSLIPMGQGSDDQGSDDDKSDDDQDDDKEADDSDDEDDKDQNVDPKDGKTSFSQDQGKGKPNQSGVNEEATNAMLTVGKGKKDAMGTKLEQPPSGGKGKDPLNSKLEVGKSRKDGSGPTGGKTDGQNDSNKKNNVDTQSLPTVASKITVGEHVSAMFAGQELSEEFMNNASVIFEAAVSQIVEQRLDEQVEALQEEFQVKLEESVEAVQTELVEAIDGFMNRLAEQWIEDNRIAVESGIKVEMVTNFMDGLKTLFTESYIEVPEDKLDVVEEQASKIEELRSALVTIDEAHDQAVAEVTKLKKEKIVEHVANGMTVLEKEKLSTLCEGLAFESEEDFESKVKVVKSSYFATGSKQISEQKQTSVAAPINEDVTMDRYVKALKNPLNFHNT